jgi:methylated-DNA-protein-cysteine methyltransferase-like protein
MAPAEGFVEAVEEVVRALEPGEIATYGEIAEEAGYPGAARGVGRVMATSDGLPWWRVVAANGRLVPGHEDEHVRRLADEGVAVENGRVRRAR